MKYTNPIQPNIAEVMSGSVDYNSYFVPEEFLTNYCWGNESTSIKYGTTFLFPRYQK